MRTKIGPQSVVKQSTRTTFARIWADHWNFKRRTWGWEGKKTSTWKHDWVQVRVGKGENENKNWWTYQISVRSEKDYEE